MIDICSRELGCNIPCGAAEERIDEVLLLEEHAAVVWTLSSVVEGEDALVLLGSQVGPLCLAAVGVVGR